jgi:hypothetical protein
MFRTVAASLDAYARIGTPPGTTGATNAGERPKKIPPLSPTKAVGSNQTGAPEAATTMNIGAAFIPRNTTN